ncbi:MAG TPA: hypothetical protein VGG59_03745 [Acidobacteriaceae bacterium]|jgi:hypothetical protein
MRPRHAWLSLLVIGLIVAFRLLSNHPASDSNAPITPATSTAPASPSAMSRGSRDVAVPQSCTPDVNQKLAGLLAQHRTQNVDNVMVCGTTVSPSRTQRGGEHGSHEILPLLVNLPGAGSKLVEVVTNDDLDGVVTAPKDAQVYAYGQAFFDQGSRFVAGIHDVHCSTHRTADNGWVVVNGAKSPASCAAHR